MSTSEDMTDALADVRLEAESARNEASAASMTADQTRRDWNVMVERLRRMETMMFGQPQQGEQRQEMSRKQRRKRGISEYEPAP